MKKLIFENVSGDYSYFNVYMANFYFLHFIISSFNFEQYNQVQATCLCVCFLFRHQIKTVLVLIREQITKTFNMVFILIICL